MHRVSVILALTEAGELKVQTFLSNIVGLSLVWCYIRHHIKVNYLLECYPFSRKHWCQYRYIQLEPQKEEI